MSAATQHRVLAPGDGQPVDLGLGCPLIKLGPHQGSTQIGLVESEIPPGGGFRIPHWHDDLDEVFYVLDGELEFLLGESWVSAPAGTTVLVPAGTVHAFRNTTERTARQLVIGSPEVAELIGDLGDHPRQAWEAVHERHRSHYAATTAG